MDRLAVGLAGEAVAAAFLESRGLQVLARRMRVGSGELDIVGLLGGEKVAFEVRSVTGSRSPLDAFGPAKFDQVWRLAREAGCSRVDLVAVALSRTGAEVHWVPAVRRG